MKHTRGPASTSRKTTHDFVVVRFVFPSSRLPTPTPLPFPRQPNPNLQRDGFDNGHGFNNGDEFDNSHGFNNGDEFDNGDRFDDEEAGPTSARRIRQRRDNPSIRPNLSNPTNAAHRRHVQGVEPTTRKGNDTKRREMGLQQQRSRE